MVNNWSWGLSCVLVLGALCAPLTAADKLSTVAPAADLVAEAEAKLAELETFAADEAAFGKNKKKGIPQGAGVLAMLAQGIAEHDEDSKLKKSAADLRDAALALAKAGSLADAQKAITAAKAAAGGTAAGAKAEHAWDKLIDLDSVMAEISARNGKIRKTLRKLPDDVNAAARDASVLAMLAVVTAADTHEVKDKADIEKWKNLSKEMQVEMTTLAAAIKAKEVDKAKEAFSAGGKACNTCHSEIRDK